MSIDTMKNALETYLKTNVTTTAIKYNMTSYYELNGVALNQSQIDALDFFIAPSIVPISQDREMMSSSNPFRYEIFFQIDIYSKPTDGMGATYEAVDDLETLFREKTISNIVCLRTETISTIEKDGWVITPYRILCYLWG